MSGTKSLNTFICGNGFILVQVSQLTGEIHANVFPPLIFILHQPHAPSLHEGQNESVGSIVFLISKSTSNIIGPATFFFSNLNS